MTREERAGRRPRIASRKNAGNSHTEEFQQHRSFKISSRDGGRRRPEGDNEDYDRKNSGTRFRAEKDNSDRPRADRKFGDRRRESDSSERKFNDRPRADRKFGDRRRESDNKERKFNDRPRADRKFGDRRRESDNDERRFNDRSRADRRDEGNRRKYDDARVRGRGFDKGPRSRRFDDNDSEDEKPKTGRKGYQRVKDPLYDRPKATGLIRLNKYLADSGVCSRREADELIKAGCVTVNGEVVTAMGVKVGPEDKVNYGGQTLNREKLRYILLNKPKGYITTSDDPQERETVMELVKDACPERIFPVGRLDKLTTGLLLFTNDGDLAKTLTHPSHEVSKLYHVTLNKPLTKNDMLRISEGLVLDDGPIEIDSIAYVDDDDSKKEIGIEIHSGRNRIVRRIFEHLGYQVDKLDRVMFAGLDKYKLPRGSWRFLTDIEVLNLKRIK